ncbi:glycoside hydrolase family 43 protein [Streptomyces sp. 8K308]|uniref:glycoside hydrolase family 43 protein n=1 Tax=Streptomyces sp. 8K308 TaxID=2530388 RepID=UPI00104EA157|nr:glycoside hydrolase family 43 protein [Streptomyces sp. 8K308]TDC21284.1 glycoside hydrolase family 43 protein [Streptomyces sp. 8K308]
MPVAEIRPVIAGCHPDPSICRVGEDHYLVTSSFAYFPGLPVHRSRDLVRWERVGHVLADPAHVDLAGLDVSDGVWAPTIRYHDGLFYVVYTVAEHRRGRATFVTTASDPAGPWSTPVDLGAEGIDPSLFFDVDGRAWFTATRDALSADAPGPAEIYLREFDHRALRLVGQERVIWHGALTGAWVEAPHLYRRGEVYHLLAAEGGTERNHAVTAATASSPTGPYATDPRSPLLTHRHMGAGASVHNVGHADLVDTPAGDTWAVVLGVRPVDGAHTLGREVFLVPVSWEPEGPVFAPGIGALTGPGAEEDPEGDAPADWVGLRGPVEHRWHGADLELAPAPDDLASLGRPAFLGRRQDRHHFAFAATVPAPASVDQHTALVAFQNQDRFIAQVVRRAPDGAVAIETVLRSHGTDTVLAHRAGAERQRLGIRSDGRRYSFGAVADGVFDAHATVEARLLSTEDAGGFVGVLLGVAHHGPIGTPWATVEAVSYPGAD